MAGKGTVSISVVVEEGKDGLKKLTLDADGLRKIMEESVKVTERLQKSVYKVAATSTAIKAVSDAVGQLNSVFNELTGESLEFGKAMKAANTMAGKDSAGFKQLKGDVADLAKQLPIARDQLANGLYQVISNGVPEDNWLDYLNTSARSAIGGMADINKVVGVTSTVIKNYGLEWSAAADIQDKIQLTAKNGVTSFEQLAQALPRVTGNAATLGVTIDELLGTFATLTGVSGNTAEVSTQLGAIFTALVKPSSEAAEMAAKMGIQFDAAAIKAAGGFQNFLQQLDRSIKAYATANGVLEQEVYSKLFGSAESLRALIPLQGELAEKFTTNVAAMVDSAGTMDAAYNDMASTGGAVNQMLRNQWAAVVDMVAGVTSAAQPYINFTAGLLSTASSATILITTFKQLNVVQMLVATRAKLVSIAMVTLGLRGKSAAAVVRVFSATLRAGAFSATSFKIALRGLMIATGIGAAIAAVTTIVGYFSNAVDDAGDKADEAAAEIKELTDTSEAYVSAAAKAKEEISKVSKELDGLINANKDTSDAVAQLNTTYGDIFGTFRTAAEWQKVLTKNSEAYVKQIGLQAQAQANASRLAEISVKKELAARALGKWERENAKKMRRGSKDKVTGLTEMFSTEEEWKELRKNLDILNEAENELLETSEVINGQMKEISASILTGAKAANKEIKVSEMSLGQVKKELEKTQSVIDDTSDIKRLQQLGAYYQQLTARKKELEKISGTEKGGKNKKLVSNPKNKEDLQNNINLLSEKLTGEDTPEQQKIIKDIALYKKKLSAIELAQKAATRPTELQSLEDIDREIEYQQALRNTAAAENIADIDSEIEELEKLREVKKRSGRATAPIDKIETYAQLEKEVSYYTWLVQNGTEKERIFAQTNLNALAKVRKSWDDTLSDLKKPGDISTLNTIEKLDEAISYYQAKQKQATAEEIQNIQLTINSYERKRNALQRGIEIPSMQREAAEINKLTGRDYKLKIRGMGFEELTAKIKDLQRQLKDTDNPLTKSQRKDIESLIGVYEQWRRESIDTFDTFRKGWDGVKGIGSGIEGITSALEGNGNAWQKITGIIDGFLQIYDGIAAIVKIIDMLTIATTTHTTAKTAEAVAVGASTGAQTAEAVSAEVAAAAQIPVIAANKLATASYMELAAAAYFAAHAYIPFAGFGIASGFVAAATAMVQAIGVMPFANGGIVSGPTIGLIGEYAGASNNPEVVAPLDKLRGMLQQTEGGVSGKVTFKIDGRTLVGILEKENNIKHRS